MAANSAQMYERPAWLIIVLSIAPAIGLGICRFADALVLPDMLDSLDWSYASAGLPDLIRRAVYIRCTIRVSSNWVQDLAMRLALERIPKTMGLHHLGLAATRQCHERDDPDDMRCPRMCAFADRNRCRAIRHLGMLVGEFEFHHTNDPLQRGSDHRRRRRCSIYLARSRWKRPCGFG
jgi:hypothetical protein